MSLTQRPELPRFEVAENRKDWFVEPVDKVYDHWARYYTRKHFKPVVFSKIAEAKQATDSVLTEALETRDLQRVGLKALRAGEGLPIPTIKLMANTWGGLTMVDVFVLKDHRGLPDVAVRMIDVVLDGQAQESMFPSLWILWPDRLNKLLDGTTPPPPVDFDEVGYDHVDSWDITQTVAAAIRIHITTWARIDSLKRAISSLSRILWTIIDQDYPDSLPAWSELAPEEQDGIDLDRNFMFREDIRRRYYDDLRPKGYTQSDAFDLLCNEYKYKYGVVRQIVYMNGGYSNDKEASRYGSKGPA